MLANYNLNSYEVRSAMNEIMDGVDQYLIYCNELARLIYQMILEKCKMSNERLWFSTNFRLQQAYLMERGDEPFIRIISELKSFKLGWSQG